MIVLTTGKSYIDIDGYASCLAYRELLKLQGIESKFVSYATLNYSVTKSLLELPFHIDDYEINQDDTFIILDLSNRDFFPDFVTEEAVVELIDHHLGFENYWKDRLNEKAIIEQIGSVATIIVEKYEQCNLLQEIDIEVAKLLMAAILDNTLNFTAKITNERDKVAYSKLEKIINDVNFSDMYFSECQDTIESNLEEAIVNDLKFEKVNEYLPHIFGQLTIWDINKLLRQVNKIEEIISKYGDEWIINIISLKDNTSYIICSDDRVKSNIEKLFDCRSNHNMLIVEPAKLRKEIMGIALLKKE